MDSANVEQPERSKESTAKPGASKDVKSKNSKKDKVNDTSLQKRSQADRAGIQFPPARMTRLLRKGNYSSHISPAAGIYVAATIEYLVAEILELAGNAATENRKKRINPRYIQMAVRNDEELSKLLHGVTISEGGVMPFIHRELLPKKKTKDDEDKPRSSQEF